MKLLKAFFSISIVATLVFVSLPAQAFAEGISNDPPVIATGQAECIGYDAVSITGSVYEADSIAEFGVEVGTEDDLSDAVVHVGIGSGSIFMVNGLNGDTQYYYRSYLYDTGENIYYGDIEEFTTPEIPTQGTADESKQRLVSDIAFLNSMLETLGLDASTFATLPEREAGFYEELASYANIYDQNGSLDFSSMPTSDSASLPSFSMSSADSLYLLEGGSEVLGTEDLSGIEQLSDRAASAGLDALLDSNTTDSNAPAALLVESTSSIFDLDTMENKATVESLRFIYACEIAEQNIGRDPDAGIYEDEAVYMYLSHYIDMQPGDIGTAPNYNSNARKYSAWITYYDREVYDSYLSASGKLTLANQMRETAVALANFGNGAKDLWDSANATSKIVEWARNTITGIAMADDARYLVSTGDAAYTLSQSLNDPEKSAQDIVDDMLNVISGQNYGEETASFIVSSAISISLGIAVGTLGVGAPVGLLVGAAIYAVNITAMLASDLTGYIYWLQMEQSLSGRLPGRILRYYGMW